MVSDRRVPMLSVRIPGISRGLGVAAALVLAASHQAWSTPLALAHELEGPGLSVAVAGAGLRSSRSATLTVDVPGRVSLALLVWSGRGPCRTDPTTDECGLGVEPFPDQVLTFGGVPVTGEVAGFELRSDGGAVTLAVGYVADVTDAVAARGPGRLSFGVADPDRHSDLRELEGAGLLVASTDPDEAGTYRLAVRLGLDFAWGEAAERGDSQATDPFAFIHGAAKLERRADLLLFVGGAEPNRPDRIDVTGNASLFDRLDSSEGTRWDAERLRVRIPGAVGTTSVQVFSEPVGRNPDSLSWSLAALHLPLPSSAGCAASFWNARTDVWRGLKPSQRVGDVFGTNPHYQSLSGSHLRLVLRFQDGPGLLGAAKALLREGTAALLNAVHPEVELPLIRGQVVRRVGDALDTRDPGVILALADELAEMNAAACPLD